MKKFLLLLSLFVAYSTQAQILINEVDADQPGTDAAEFIEIIGEPFAALDGYVVVLFNGSTDVVYASYDLAGFTLDANGLFVLGNAGVPGAQIELPSNGIQNGADAVAIFAGTAAEWPVSAPLGNTNLIDALVYGTDDADDAELLATLNPTGFQVNEAPNGTTSMSRVPDGGDAFDANAFVEQDPTPNAFNDAEPLVCDAGFITGPSGAADYQICTNEAFGEQVFEYTSASAAANYIYIITDMSNNIVGYDEDGSIDFSVLGNGNYQVYGFTYSGNLNIISLVNGNPISGVSSDDCFHLAPDPIAVELLDCSIPICSGGTLSSASLYNVFCTDGLIDQLNYSSEGGTAANYAYILTDDNNMIVAYLGMNTAVFAENYDPGTYRIWGIDYDGNLDPTTLEEGDDATMIVTDGGCLALSTNYVTMIVVTCETENGCSELMISEYFEGQSFNKAIEIFNPTNFPVDLSEYEVHIYGNGAAEFTGVFVPEGILLGGETYVIANSQADQAILDIANATSAVTNFNGDDAISLSHNGTIIDVIGTIGSDPGTEWPVANGSTLNNSLIRYPFVTSPSADWAVASEQYGLGNINDFSSLGVHNYNRCSMIPQIGFSVSADTVEESIGTYTIEVVAYNIPQAIDVQVQFLDGTAFSTEDYVNDGPVTLSFEAGNSSMTFDVTIIDDDIEEDLQEYFSLVLTAATEVDWTISEFVLSIEPNDQSYPLYNIADVTTVDADGVIENMDLYCELRGIVHGINFNSDGIHFHIIDPTDGIKVFSADQNFGYTVTEGDSVSVMGYITQFMGQAEIRPDFITLIDGGHPLETPTVVTSLTEENESHMVQISCVELVDPAQWNTTESFFVVDVTDGTNVLQVLVDGDTELFSGDVLNGHFTLTGIVEQMDDEMPYDNNYVILPRYAADITNQVIADFNMDNPLTYGENGAEVAFVHTSTGATSYEWDFGDGNTLEEENPTHMYSFDFLSGQADLTVMLYATNNGCTDVTAVTVDLVFSNVNELEFATLQMFPNPASTEVRISSDVNINGYKVVDMTGRVVASNSNVNTNAFVIDVNGFANGVYMINIFNENGSATKQLVVRK